MSYVALAKAAVARLRATPSPESRIAEAAPLVDVAHLLSMPLTRFAQEGHPLEVRVSWWPATLFFVPGARASRRSGARESAMSGCGQLASCLHLLDGEPPTPEALRIIMIARREFGGEVVAGRSHVRDRQEPAG